VERPAWNAHLKDTERHARLLALVMIDFIWCHKTGIHLHEKVKPIKVKGPKRKAGSTFKYGLEIYRQLAAQPPVLYKNRY
jgi:hypothetical protein